MIELVVRLVFSLAVVIGMLLLLAKFSAKRFRGTSGSLIRVVHRQPLSRTSSVAVVTVGSRVLVVGTTEQQVQLLTELDPDELAPTLASCDVVAIGSASDDVPPVPAETSSVALAIATSSHDAGGGKHAVRRKGDRADKRSRGDRAGRATRAARASDGALAGSLLSSQTWKQAMAAATSRNQSAS